MSGGRGDNWAISSGGGDRGGLYPNLMPVNDYRQFSNNADAHTYMNTILNSGSGHVGVVATARNLSYSGPLTPASQQLNGRALFESRLGQNGDIRGPGPEGFFNMGRQIWVHGPRQFPSPDSNTLTRQVARRTGPSPSGVVMLLATVDRPVRDRSGNGSRRSGSPVSSISSQNSFGSGLSSPCQCPNCSGCRCHMYCEHHARIRCPVHGQGIDSSDEDSGIETTSQRSISSLSSSLSSGSSSSGHSSCNSLSPPFAPLF